MRMFDWSIVRGVAVGFLGAFIATWSGLPAAPLVGSAVATAALCMAGHGFALPQWLTRVAFVTVGLAMGSGISPATLTGANEWAVSLLIMTACMFVILATNTILLTKVFKWDRNTALLASAPGALSAVVGLAAEGHGDVVKVSVAQSVRLALITLMVPVVSIWITLPDLPIRETTLATALLIPPAFVIGSFLTKWRVPTAHLLTGLILSAVAYLSGVLNHTPSAYMTIPGFVLIGTLIGSRFSGVGPGSQRKTILAGISLTCLGGLTALVFAWMAVHLTDIDPVSATIAYVPGGVEGMGAMALALNAAPAVVAAHHLVRILVVSLFVPMLFAGRKA